MSKKFSEEEKYKLVEKYCNGESVSDIFTATGIAKSTFYTWIKPYQTQSTDAGYVVSAAEFVKMKKRLAKLEEIVEGLKKTLRNVGEFFADLFKNIVIALPVLAILAVLAIAVILILRRAVKKRRIKRNEKISNVERERDTGSEGSDNA